MSDDPKYPITLPMLWNSVITAAETSTLEFPSPPNWSGAVSYSYKLAPGIIPLTEGVGE